MDIIGDKYFISHDFPNTSFLSCMNYTITIYNSVILVRSVIKFLDRNFLFIKKV